MVNKTTYTPSISFNNNVLPFKSVVLTVISSKPYKCSKCQEAITINQIEKTLSETKNLTNDQIIFINKISPFINKYRTTHKLDTFLRKAHFIAQIGA